MTNPTINVRIPRYSVVVVVVCGCDDDDDDDVCIIVPIQCGVLQMIPHMALMHQNPNADVGMDNTGVNRASCPRCCIIRYNKNNTKRLLHTITAIELHTIRIFILDDDVNCNTRV